MTTWLGEESIRGLVTVLGHSLWQGGIVALLLGIFCREWLIRSSAARYAVASLSLWLVAMGVAATAWMVWPSGDAASISSDLVVVPGDSMEWAGTGHESLVGAGGRPEEATPLVAPNDSSRFAPTIALVYVFGVFLMWGRLGLGLCRTWRLTRCASPIESTDIMVLVERKIQALQFRTAPLVRVSQQIAIPMVVGVLRPVVLLPAAILTELPNAQLAAVIEHELIHLRRWDHWMNLLQRMVEATLFFHPGVWYISRCVSRERENSCDDRVVRNGTSAVTYAELLVRITELSQIASRPAMTAIAASGRSSLRHRVTRLLRPASGVPGPALGWFMMLLFVSVLAGGLTLTALAQGTDDQPKRGQDEVGERKKDADPAPRERVDLEDGIYRVQGMKPRKDGVVADRSDTDGVVTLTRQLGTQFGEAKVTSMSNRNDRYYIQLNAAGPLAADAAKGQMALVIDGICVVVGSRTDPDPQNKMRLGAQILGKAQALQVARRLNAKIKNRTNPGHQFKATLRPLSERYDRQGPVMMEMVIKNTGSKPFRFFDGGRQRGARNNQFGFRGFSENGKREELKDEGDPRHFGGMAALRTLEPGKEFRKQVDLRKWFKLAQPGTYTIVGRYEFEIHDRKQSEYRLHWDDVAEAKCLVQIGKPTNARRDPRLVGVWMNGKRQLILRKDGSYQWGKESGRWSVEGNKLVRVVEKSPSNELVGKSYSEPIIGVSDSEMKMGTQTKSKLFRKVKIFHGWPLHPDKAQRDTAKLPDLWEERPPGSKSYELRDDVKVMYHGIDGGVYYRPDKKLFYVQSDPFGSSVMTFYGPYQGDPTKLMKIEGGNVGVKGKKTSIHYTLTITNAPKSRWAPDGVAYMLGVRPVMPKKLEDEIKKLFKSQKKPTLRLRVGEEVLHEVVVKTIDIAAKLGVQELTLMTYQKPKEKKEAK